MSEPKLNLVTTASTAAPDPFDLDSLRVSQAFTETAGVKKLLRTVPVHKPKPQDFVRVHPSDQYRLDVPLVELKDDREDYLVVRDLLGELTGEIVLKTLFTAINRQGVLFLWPVRLPDPEGRQNEWHRSMREATEIGMTQWTRVKANMSLGAYEITVADGAMVEPVWPDVPFQELIRLAFRDRLITAIDHPVIKRLRGLG
jgi:hypothetical protein